jgi:Alternative complex III, ActD subunit
MAAEPYGLVATFDTAPAIYHAAERVRDAGYQKWDCISPAPIHGLSGAMGLKRSIVPRISLCGGIAGFCTGMTMIWWIDAYNYPLVVGGKPFFSPLFAFPVSYELTILFTAFATIIGMFCLNGLTKLYHPVLKYEQMVRAMDDRFLIVIETADPKFDPVETRALLERIGGHDIAELAP